MLKLINDSNKNKFIIKLKSTIKKFWTGKLPVDDDNIIISFLSSFYSSKSFDKNNNPEKKMNHIKRRHL